MRAFILAVTVTMLAATPLFAQTERGYITGAGGFAVSPNTTSGDVLFEGGVRIAPHLLVFGDLGQFHNLQPSDVQATVDSAMALSADQGLGVTGSARVPARYATGGLRYEVLTKGPVLPYVLGGAGMARLSPTAVFTFASGVLPDGSTPSVGDDVTPQVVSAGYFTTPVSTNVFMFSLGGGVAIPMAHRWTADLGYRFSRVSSDTPLNTQGVTFGLGYRF